MASGKPVHRALTLDLGFDCIQLGNLPEPVFGNRRGAVFGNLEQLAPGMGPTVGKLDRCATAIRSGQPVIGGIAIDLENPAKTIKNFFTKGTAASGGIAIGHPRRVFAAPWPVVAGQGQK